MRAGLLVGVLLAGLTGGVAPAQDGAAIRGVISDQIAALRADDFETAFSFASPAIRRIFGGPDRFGAMVRDGYPMVWRPADVRFGGIEDRGGRLVQGVIVTDQAGALHLLEYEMVLVDGAWRINGVRLRPSGDIGA